jgi:acyl-CoA thioesterase I
MRVSMLRILLWVTMTCHLTTAQAKEAIEIIVFGDSLTAGYGLPIAEIFPVKLQENLTSLGYKVKVVNASVSGDTTAGGKTRVNWVLANHPEADIVLLELGANDALRGLPPENVRKNLEDILIQFKERNINVLLIGMKAPPNLGKGYQTAFDSIYPDLAKKYKTAFYPFFLEGVVSKAELNQEDTIHPNGKGIAIIITKIQPYVEKLLQ